MIGKNKTKQTNKQQQQQKQTSWSEVQNRQKSERLDLSPVIQAF